MPDFLSAVKSRTHTQREGKRENISSGKTALIHLQKKPEEEVGLVSKNRAMKLASLVQFPLPGGSIASPILRELKLRLGLAKGAWALKPSMEEAEAGRPLCVQGQPGTHSETLVSKKANRTAVRLLSLSSQRCAAPFSLGRGSFQGTVVGPSLEEGSYFSRRSHWVEGEEDRGGH